MDALDVLVELIDPAQEIFGDPKIAEMVKNGNTSVVVIIKTILVDHKEATWKLLAGVKGVSVEEYRKASLKTIVTDFINLTKDEEIMSFFSLQGQREA